MGSGNMLNRVFKFFYSMYEGGQACTGPGEISFCSQCNYQSQPFDCSHGSPMLSENQKGITCDGYLVA